MSRFKTMTIDTDDVGSWVVRRRKGRMIRKQHTVTGKWSGWLFDYTTPRYTAERAEMNTSLPVEALSVLDDVRKRTDANLNKMTVAELRTLAGNRGIKVPSKARKADLISALTN